MKPLILLLIPVMLGLAGPVDSLCEQAEWLLFNRHEGTGRLDSARSLLARARTLDPQHEYCLYLWSRIHIQMGDDARERGRKLAYYERARAIADTLKALNDENPLGHIWWGVARGRIGQTRGVLNSLAMVPSLRSAFGRALELDPENIPAYAAFGVLYYELPGFAGGDLAKSEQYLRQGLKLDPDYTQLRLELARTLIKRRRPAEARVELERMLATANPTIPADFVLDDKPRALELLRELGPD